MIFIVQIMRWVESQMVGQTFYDAIEAPNTEVAEAKAFKALHVHLGDDPQQLIADGYLFAYDANQKFVAYTEEDGTHIQMVSKITRIRKPEDVLKAMTEIESVDYPDKGFNKLRSIRDHLAKNDRFVTFFA